MAITTGMRGKDLKVFLRVARKYGVIILVRHTNADSLAYVSQPGFYPKPAAVKAKTADQNPAAQYVLAGGRKQVRQYMIAGLVVHPGFQPGAYLGAKVAKAQDCWDHTMEALSPTLVKQRVDLDKPDTWALWGVERRGVAASRWSWRVDIDPESPRFGCLQLKSDRIGWSYVHGDYDLKDVIVLGAEDDNRRHEGKLDGVKNFTALLRGMEFTTIQDDLNREMGVEMVQHGAEAQFAWHGDEPITVAYPDGNHLILASAETVQGWYMNMNRRVLASVGHDYLADRSRWFHFGPGGDLFAPGGLPSMSWG